MADPKTETAPAVAEAPVVSAVEAAPIVTAKAITFAAPEHVSQVHFSTGRHVDVVDGKLIAPADLVSSESADLARLGFKAV